MSPSLRRYGRRIAAVLLVVALLVPLATGVGAAQSVEGASGTVVVEAGETVDRVDAVAGTVVVRGTVAGDVSGAAGSIRIAESGRVEGSLRAAAGTVVVSGTVEGDVEGGGGAFELTETGRIGGDVDVGAGSIVVDGAVDGDVRAAANSVTLGPSAEVGGEFRYDAEEFDRSPDAAVAGGVVEDPSLAGDGGVGGGTDLLPGWIGTAYGLVVSVVLGALLLVAFPRFSRELADRVADDPLPSGGVGLVALVGVPILLALVAVTVVGIPFALVGIVAYVVAIWTAGVYGKYAVGTWVLSRAGRENRWLALLAGVIGFALLGLVPVLGPLLEFVALLLGLGALAMGLRGRYRGRDAGPSSAS